MTTVSDGLFQFGGVPVGLPPISGTYFHVNPYSGSAGNSGLTRDEPLDNFKTAYDKCTTGAGDGIIVWSHVTSTTANTTSYLTAALDFSKSGITVYGVCAPTCFAQRARISSASTALTLTHLINVSGSGNSFYNVSMGNYGSDATALGGVRVTSSSRNYFYNCHFIGAGHATPAATALANSLALSSAIECMFERCTIGTDTVSSVGTNQTYNMIFTDGCARNMFKDCLFLSTTTSGQAAHLAIAVGGAGDGITQSQYFKNCIFHNYNLGALSAQTSLVGYPTAAPNNGYLLFHDCAILGYADVDSGSAAVCYSSRAAAGADGGVMAAC